MFAYRFWSLLAVAVSVVKADELDDFHQFVTVLVGKHDSDAASPGYLFLAPYTNLTPERPTPTKELRSCQTGAHIYDGNGNLVWSGAQTYENRRVLGFMPVEVNGTQHLSFHLAGPGKDAAGGGSLVLLNNHYEEVLRYGTPRLDFHECAFGPDGKTVLFGTRPTDHRPDIKESQDRKVWGTGFREVDLANGKTIIDWNALDHGVSLDESFKERVPLHGADGWDWLHINSVQKTDDGNYLVSARHTHTVYMVSGKDHKVLWRLGGRKSDFALGDGVAFKWQHHARLLHENETHTVISIFDNHSEQETERANVPVDRNPSAKFILLETKSLPMKATLLRKLDRPDAGHSPKLGSIQTIGADVQSANVLVDWALGGHLTEFDAQNRIVLEMKFAAEKYNNYRAFKLPFSGHPEEKPVVKVLPIGFAADEVASALYVSWNGATEVSSWAFYSSNSPNTTFTHLGTVPRSGFETSWVTTELIPFAYAEALDATGAFLGRSNIYSLDPESDDKEHFKSLIPLLEAKSDHPNGGSRLGLTQYSMSNWAFALCALLSAAVLIPLAYLGGNRLSLGRRQWLGLMGSRGEYRVVPNGNEISEQVCFVD